VTNVLPEIEHTTLHERVYEVLRDALMSGQFVPGQTITLRELSDRFNVSNTPVRSALNQLVAKGAVSGTANRSVRVRKLTRPEFDDLCSMRELVEGTVAATAAARADESLPEELVRLNTAMLSASREGDPQKVLSMNKEFHFALYAAGSTPISMEIIANLWLIAGPHLAAVIRETAAEHSEEEMISDHHLDLIEAVRRNEPSLARTAIAGDIRDFKARIEEHLVS